MAEKMGKVWLVGAGPSDIGLLTLKGLRVLEQAQAVVYDQLVGLEILLRIPAGAEAIDVGKQAGNHKKTQEEINRILLEKALEGKRVVRLKGGDPFLFGRGGEELELLRAHGVPFEIVPGVTSALAVPAYNGIPVTHREFASSVHIITGHRKAGEALDIDFQSLAKGGGPLVFLMGVRSLPEIVRGLLAAGMPADTPAAVLERGTSAGQRRVVAALGELEDEAGRQGIGTPAIIVVGEVCKLAETFGWYEQLPLFGEKILVTRPRDRASRLSEKLRELGAETVSLPSIETVPVSDDETKAKIGEAIERLGEYDLLAFTSPYGVKRFFELLRECGRDIRELAGAKLAAIGPATAQALEERGLRVDLVPERYDGRSLGKAVAAWAENAMERQPELNRTQKTGAAVKILIPRAREGSKDLTEALSAAANDRFAVTDLPVYETIWQPEQSSAVPASVLETIKSQIISGEITWLTFTSASTVRGFAARFPDLDFSGLRALCIGEQTGAAARALGMSVWISREATVDSMVERLVELRNCE